MPIAPGSLTQLPPNSTGPKLATGPTYTENAQVVQDEKVILGEQYLAGYTVYSGATSTATVDSHNLQIMAGASLTVRVRRIVVYQTALATTAVTGAFGLYRLTTAGTGGTIVTASALDPADGASGATGMTLPAVKGTEGVLIDFASAVLLQTIGASTVMQQPLWVWDFDRPRSKPLIIAAGVTKGLAVKNLIAVAAAAIRVVAYFDEASWA